MSEARRKTTPPIELVPFKLDLIDLDRHPDAALLRACAALDRLRLAVEELELVAASLTVRTMLGRRMKEMTL